ncbi:MAG: V4R domain-containing protein [Promethearchaeati archaeon SRVP18_Atabeyarchaeia-1]
MDETTHATTSIAGSNTSGTEYPMRELADRLRMPNVKTSFSVMKSLVTMPIDGKIIEKMTGFHVITYPSLFVLGIWSALYEILGKRLAPKIITSFHRDTGRTIVQVGRRNFGLKDQFAFEFYFWLISAIGWGEIKGFKFDPEKIEGFWQLEYKGSLPKNAPKDATFHDNFKGEIIAAGDEAFHVPLEVRETKCMAKGDPFCEFTWKKADAAENVTEPVRAMVLEESAKPTTPTPGEAQTLKNDFKEALKNTNMLDEGKLTYHDINGEVQVATKDVQSIVGLTYRASDMLGEGTVRAVFVRTGSLFAAEDVKRYKSTGKQLVEEYMKYMAITGWGMFNVTDLGENGGEVTCERSAFAEEYPRGNKAVCYFVVGILAALMERAFGQRYMVKETDCIAKGSPKCRFEIRGLPK